MILLGRTPFGDHAFSKLTVDVEIIDRLGRPREEPVEATPVPQPIVGHITGPDLRPGAIRLPAWLGGLALADRLGIRSEN